ncbi:MAG: 5'-nucleotidase, lipoprotein e(P4) family [Gammaproteobacteria bacterium]|nr:MAG: 5'-nucleotidase, lipoprotein e(P4) family [Gammaproteobacteria bacterium]
MTRVCPVTEDARDPRLTRRSPAIPGFMVALVFSALPVGCAAPPADERLHSTLWVQTSAEYQVSARQVYSIATERLEDSIADLSHAERAVGAPGDQRPPAIIVDVDETVLENSGHTARGILARRGYSRETWRAWVLESAAPAVPGAVPYLEAAAAMDVTIFYVTNRKHDLEEATRRNLIAVGCPLRTDIDVVLTRRERPEWTRDKTSRREYVAERYSVLQLVGDDLVDFVSIPAGATDEDRVALAESHSGRWGTVWFVLPNPIYGTWEQALMPGGDSMFAQPIEQKFKHLETR